MSKRILWDWNGTLLDDTQAALDTLNIMIAERGGAPIGMDFYRRRFAFPVRPFYGEIGIVAHDEAEWDRIAREYHDVYAARPKRLNREAVPALELARSAGASQFVISALRQDLLEADVARYGLVGYFEALYGTDNLDGGSKLSRARELLARISGEGAAPDDVVVIGDALHDKEVADALGVRCVLCGQGSHSSERLSRVAPTGETLGESVEMALRL